MGVRARACVCFDKFRICENLISSDSDFIFYFRYSCYTFRREKDRFGFFVYGIRAFSIDGNTLILVYLVLLLPSSCKFCGAARGVAGTGICASSLVSLRRDNQRNVARGELAPGRTARSRAPLFLSTIFFSLFIFFILRQVSREQPKLQRARETKRASLEARDGSKRALFLFLPSLKLCALCVFIFSSNVSCDIHWKIQTRNIREAKIRDLSLDFRPRNHSNQWKFVIFPLPFRKLIFRHPNSLCKGIEVLFSHVPQ